MSRRLISGGASLTALALLLLATGCRVGTDLPEPELAELELAEAAELTEALLVATLIHSVYSDNHVAFAHSHGTSSLHTHPIIGPYVHDGEPTTGPNLSHHNLFDFDLAAEAPCAGGGSVLIESEITGEGNPAVGVGHVHYVMIQTHRACSVSLTAAGGDEFVLDASPYLTVEAHAVNDGTTTRIYGLAEGGLAWQTEAKGGTCTLEITYEAFAPTMGEITEVAVTGTICDLEVDEAISVAALLS